mmetsp:Transcript_16805/g.25101  ORF Transcript_16805/g.25101 Transcript_16805/m.25101 type:complete len:307 (+) Transcript_16805:232-1152(+)
MSLTKLETSSSSSRDPFTPLDTPIKLGSRNLSVDQLVDKLSELPISDSSEVLTEPIFTQKYLNFLNKKLKSLPLDKFLEWVAVSLPNVVQVTSFGPSGMVVLHHLAKLGIRIPTVFIDTLHHFDETITHAKAAARRYDIDLRVYRCQFAHTEQEFHQLTNAKELWKTDPLNYDQLVKVEPLERALNELNVTAWITGRRRSQGDARSTLELLEIDPVDLRLKINPLAHWTYEEIWREIVKKNILYNPLHDEGYKSVGDKYTTRAVGDQDSERSGRFVQHQGKTECGIHNRPRRKRGPSPDTNPISID